MDRQVNNATSGKVVRIGGASGFWGDSRLGPEQLVRAGGIEYLVFDYLAELTMSILAGARMKKPEEGYAIDFVTVALRSVLKQAIEQRIRIVSNAGGVNPKGCAAAVQALADELGVKVRVAVVEGDDVLPLADAMRRHGAVDMSSGQPLPERLVTANAYLGALPIARALDAGADIVITGRCVDSAVTLGVLMHEFGWAADDFDRLAAGSLAGHIIECGCQATGGLHTDWDRVPDWANIGYPIVECREDGSFVVTKPPETGGLVTPATVGEQLLYEIGDPANYLLPDVTCDFRAVRMEQVGPASRARDRRAWPPADEHLQGQRHRTRGLQGVGAAHHRGHRCPGQGEANGRGAARARRAAAARARVRGVPRDERRAARHRVRLRAACAAVADARSRAAPDGDACRTPRAGDVQPRVRRARHLVVAGHDRFGRPSLGVAGVAAGRLARSQGAGLTPTVTVDGTTFAVALPPLRPQLAPEPLASAALALPAGPRKTVPLVKIAFGRSGDKGDTSNIGLIARRPALLAVLMEQVTPERVKEYLGHLVHGPVHRYELPGIHAINLVCERALGGGGMASLRNDALGKGMAQMLLDMPVEVPALLLQEVKA